MRHAPLWFDQFPKSRRPAFSRLKADAETTVAIVGGGLTGAACLHACALAGMPALLLEAEVVGRGVTGGSAGVIRETPPGAFHEAAARYGKRVARGMATALRRAGLDMAAALRRHHIACDLQERDLVTFAQPDPDAVRLLKREYAARRDAGVEGAWMSPAVVRRETGLETGGAIRTHGFTLDPYKACLGLVRDSVTRGAGVHEGSPVKRIRPSRTSVDVHTDRGVVRAQMVVVTTGALPADLRALRRHLRAESLYGVLTEPLPPAARRQTGQRAAVEEPFPEPGRTIRWMRDDRVLLHGGAQPVVPARARDRALIQRTGQLMYELLLLYPAISGLQPAASWDLADYETVDGLPFVGPHRHFPRHFFAFGGARHGAGLAWLAARAALRHLQEAPAPTDAAFGFHRVQ